MTKSTILCGTCGKAVEDGDRLVEHVAGRMVNGRAVTKKTIATLHQQCQDRTVWSSNSMRDALERQAREPIR